MFRRRTRCGKNARCRRDSLGSATCYCPQSHPNGNPRKECSAGKPQQSCMYVCIKNNFIRICNKYVRNNSKRTGQKVRKRNYVCQKQLQTNKVNLSWDK